MGQISIQTKRNNEADKKKTQLHKYKTEIETFNNILIRNEEPNMKMLENSKNVKRRIRKEKQQCESYWMLLKKKMGGEILGK